MTTNLGPTTLKHAEKVNEWCHTCGKRYTGVFKELFMPPNAEHPKAAGKPRYVRICQPCCTTIASL